MDSMSRLGTENLAYNTLTGSRRHCTLKSRPSLVWHTSQLSPGYCHCFLLYYYFLFSPLFYSTGETTDGYKTGGAAPTPNGQQRRKRKPIKIGVSQCSKSGLQKNNGRIFYSSQYGAFFYFLFRPFCLDRQVCHLPFPNRSSVAPNACTVCRCTRAYHRNTKHLGWKRLWICAGHPGGGLQGGLT